ncbi:MAG: DUF559 domain-containing protein [Anaerolineaceae bacterium]
MRNRDAYQTLPFNPKLIERAREFRRAGNLPEVLLWKRIHKGLFRGYDFDRQKIIGNYIVDFFCLDCGVVLEIDGSSHDDREGYDAERDEFLTGLGLSVIRISADDVLRNLDTVMEMLYNHPALKVSAQ